MYHRNPYADVPPPPLFSSTVHLPSGNKTYGPDGYSEEFEHIEPFMVEDYESTTMALSFAQQYNYNIAWQRDLEVRVHEARGLAIESSFSIFPFFSRVHDVRVKIEVASQAERTQIVSQQEESRSFVWNESLKFQVVEPEDIRLLAYCRNFVFPNDKLGRILITPDQLIERGTVTDWFPMDTRGEVKMSLTLSAPIPTLYKLLLTRPVSFYDGKDCAEASIPTTLFPVSHLLQAN